MANRSGPPRRPLLPLSSQVSGARYCHLETRLAASSETRVALAGRELCHPDYAMTRETFPCYALEFVAGGTGELVLNGESYPLHSGVIFVYGPTSPHRIVNRSTRPMTKYFVDFWGGDVEAMLRQSHLAPGHVAQTLEVETLRSIFEQLIDEGTRNVVFSKQLCAAYLRVILLKAAAAIQPVLSADATLSSRFQQWRDFIEANCCRLRNLEDVAGELGARPAYLCRVFKQFGQPSPFQFLTQRKMNRAADLLTSTRLPIKAVALDVGYTDQGHFSRLFKNHLGCSPVDFAQRHWRVPAHSKQVGSGF